MSHPAPTRSWRRPLNGSPRPSPAARARRVVEEMRSLEVTSPAMTVQQRIRLLVDAAQRVVDAAARPLTMPGRCTRKPYIKGPHGKPLLGGETIRALVR
jgi:hypothetical protein